MYYWASPDLARVKKFCLSIPNDESRQKNWGTVRWEGAWEEKTVEDFKMKKRPKGRPKHFKFKDEWHVEIYLLAKDGLTDTEIRKKFGIPHADWIKYANSPAGMKGLAEARGGMATNGVQKFKTYVYQRLPAELKKIWDAIMGIDALPATQEDKYEQVERLFDGKGKEMRQNLFLHAYMHYNFSKAKAMQAINVDQTLFEFWKKSDPQFAALCEQLVEYKKDFCEGKLLNLVDEKDPAACIFVAKTLLRDRGYSEKVDINIQGEMKHTGLELDQLEMSLEAKRELLLALRKRQNREVIVDAVVENPMPMIAERNGR